MIPEGYRLLTTEDVGKVFGKDLELEVYIDTDTLDLYNYIPSIDSGILSLTNFITLEKFYDEMGYGTWVTRILLNDVLMWEFSWMYLEGNYTMPNDLKVESYYDSNWNVWFYVKDKSDPKTQFISDMDNLAKSIVSKAGNSGKKTIKEMKSLVDGLKTEFVTQEKTVTPTKSSQTITPDSSKDGLSKVTVNAIPDEYIIPNGTLEITENGSYDVTNKEGVDVNVPSVTTEEWDGSYTESDLGYTVTLQLGTYGSRDPFALGFTFKYSIDGGVTKIPLSGQTAPIILNNVQTIGFYDTSAAALYLGTSISGAELGYVHGGNGIVEKIINVENDMTIYVSVSATNAGGGSD